MALRFCRASMWRKRIVEKQKSGEKKEKRKLSIKLIARIMHGQKRYLLLSVVAMLIAVLMSYCVPYITSFTIDYVIGDDKNAQVPKFILEWVENNGGVEFARNNIWICALALIAITVIQSVAVHFRGRFIAMTSEGAAKTMRDELYWHLQTVPYDYHKHVSTGDIIQRCTSDVDTVRRFVSTHLLEIARTVAMVVVASVIMFSINTKMALISVALLPILALSSFFYFRLVKKQFRAYDEAEGVLSATLQENLTGVRVVRAFGQQKNEVDKFDKDSSSVRDENYKLTKMLAAYWGGSDAIGYFQIMLSLVFGIYFAVTTDFTLGQVLLFTSYTSMLTWPVRQLGRILADMGKSIVSLDRINEILSAEKEEEPGQALCPDIVGDIEFKNVCFGYDRYDDVLKDVSFTVKKGQTVAILGSTGSGKSSLVQLLQRLYTVTSGEILINGVNINDIKHEHLRSNIGIVLQEPFLYSRTIMDNIAITNTDAPKEEVYEAAKTASVHDVVMSFENGYDTIVGERGVTLSGGQKQRVAIARMLMQNAPIMIFDDSMSAVDTETDAAIRDALKLRRKDSTTFIISHRITTLCEADIILVLEDGKLVQQGNHEQLLNEDGLYKRIAHIQNMLEDELKTEGSVFCE